MEPTKVKDRAKVKTPMTSGRLVRVILIETLLVALAGLSVWGVAWDFGYPTPGLIAAIVIWLTVSPIIEIATVMDYQRSNSASDSRNQDA